MEVNSIGFSNLTERIPITTVASLLGPKDLNNGELLINRSIAYLPESRQIPGDIKATFIGVYTKKGIPSPIIFNENFTYLTN